jgi:hypothetical protein
MSRRMTVVFDDEELYTQLKVEAARAHRPAKDIVADALHTFFETARNHDAARPPAGAQRAGPPDRGTVDEILQQLGLAKEASGSPAR